MSSNNDTLIHPNRIVREKRDVRWQMNYNHNGNEDSYFDADDPAADGEPMPSSESPRLSLDDEIKLFESQFAQQARQMNQQQQAPPQPAAPQGPDVSFAEEALLYSSDRSAEEVQHMWYNREELNEFKNERKEVVRVLKKANFNLSKVEATGLYCLRGYEPYFSVEVNKAMKYARTLVLSLVLQEQERQQAEGIYYDAYAMEQAVAPASEWARENALQLGRNDEVEAFDEYSGYFRDDCEPLDFNDSCGEALDYNCTKTVATVATATSSTSYSQDDDYRSMTSDPDENDSLAYYAAHNDHLATIPDPLSSSEQEQDRAATLLGKRKDVVEQPPFSSRPHVQQHQQDTDEIAERLDSALKLVAALKATSSTSMRR